MVWVTSPSGANGGTVFSGHPVVAVEDLGGNPVPGSSVKLAIAPGTGTSGASLTCGTNPLTTASGTATFSSCAVDLAGPGYRLTAKSGGLVATSAAFAVATGSAARLAFGVQPAGGVVASPFGAQPQVVVTDAGGNPVPNLGSPVSLSISSGTLTCSVNPVSTNAAGAAQFAACEAGNTGTFTLHASAPGLGSVDSTPFKLVERRPARRSAGRGPRAADLRRLGARAQPDVGHRRRQRRDRSARSSTTAT